MVVNLKEATKLLEFIKGMTPEVEAGIVERMVGKFKGVVPEGKRSEEYLKELREEEYD
jgi:Mg2+/Co2+ transporter CorC